MKLTPPPLPPNVPPDIHTHHRDAVPGSAVVNLELGEDAPASPVLFSAGIHPWDAAKADDEAWQWLERVLTAPNAYAVGEAGIDLRRGVAPDVQMPVFVRQALLADSLGKPLIVHIVGAYDRLFEVQRDVMRRNGGHVPLWIIHGFRGKRELARQLLDHGMYISIGQHYNHDAIAVIPAGRLLRETDTATVASIDSPSYHLE